MYLKGAELQGFKSFANKTTLEFKPGITAVIGPNGSGKSNISDSIRWVLGEQSMKQLRGSKQEDIIFSGTQSRKSLGFAEVSITFDNSDGSLPIEYNEVVVTRRIYRTGESGYFINKNECRLKDITELFMDTGIGKDGYSVIGQGKIDEILSQKSDDRRHIFEEAAGIVKFRVRKEETEKKLEQTRLNLIRINDILSEIEMNLGPLEEQSKKAKQYLNLRDQLKTIEIGLFVYKINEARQKLEKNEDNKKIFTDQLLSEEQTLDNLQNEKETLKTKIEEIISEIERIQDLSANSKNEIEKINSNINVSQERISNNSQNINRLEQEIIRSKSNIEELTSEKEERLLKGADLTKNKEKYEKELKEKLAELKAITDKLSKVELENESDKRQIENLTDEKYELLNKVTINETNYANLESTIKADTKTLDSIISELDKNRIIQNDIKSAFNKVEQERKTKLDKLNAIKEEKADFDKKLKSYVEKIQTLEDEYRTKNSKLNFLLETEKEKEGYARAVKSILSESEKSIGFGKGLLGVLGDLISTDDKYQIAIEMALGNAMQNLVTEEESDAKRLIEYLRKNDIGRASFFPVNTIHGKKYDGAIKKNDGFIAIASDVVKANKKYEQIVLNLLGKTVIAKDMDSAILLARDNKYSFRIVTLEGDIINPQGSITGGSVKKSVGSILGRKTQIEKIQKEIEKIQKKIEELITEKENFEEFNKDLLSRLEKQNNEISDFEIEFAKNQERVNSINSKISELEENRDKTKKSIADDKEELNKLREEKAKIEEKIEDTNKKIQELSDKVNEFVSKNKLDHDYIDNLNQDITNLKISVSSFDESNVSIKEIVARIENDMAKETKAIKNGEEQIEKLTHNNDELQKIIVSFKKNIEEIKEQVEGSTDKLAELKNSRDSQNKEVVLVEQKIEGQFETIQKVKSEIIKIDSKEENIKQNITDLTNDLWNEYEITPNNVEQYEEIKNPHETEKQVNKLHEQIKELGDVNVGSIEEFAKTQSRYETMNEQRLDLETTIAKLHTVIIDMTNTMKKQFAEKFVLINKNFKEVFSELFGGGKAEVFLTDEEDVLKSGIEIKAEPPGKKLQNLQLLSGGEKSLTAIALLFAILKINPAPFCILDEIDAALDDVNVYRFAEYLKKFSKDTQFLVITHRKGTMEAAESIYGVTMEENGISKLLSINLKR